MKARNLLLLILFNVFWAATMPANKALSAWLHPGGVVTLRFVIAAAVMAVLWPWLPGRAPRGWDLARAAGMGVLVFVVGQRLQVYGNFLGGAANSAVLMALEPLLTSVLAGIFLREIIPARRWLGFLIGVSGVALLNGIWQPDFKWTNLTASLIFVSSFICEAAYSIISKPVIARASMTKTLAVALFAATAANLAWDGGRTFPMAQALPWQAWALLTYMAVVCTVLGYSVWLLVIKETDVNLAALTIFVQPVAGVPMAAVWLGEALHWGQFWGCVAIVLGMVVGLWRVANRSKVAAVAPSIEQA